MSGQVRAIVLVTAVICVSAIVSFVSVVALAGRGEKIFAGVSVNGVNLGNKTKVEASEALSKYTEVLRNKVVVVEFKGGSGKFNLSAIDLQANTASMVDKAFRAGRQGSFLEQWQYRRNMAKNGFEIPFEFSVSKDKLKAVLENMTKGIRVPPRDAKIIVTPEETIQIVESTSGVGIDINDAYEQLLGIVKEGDKPEIIITTVDIKPSVSSEDVRNMKVNGVVSEFTTNFNIKMVNRTFNVKVAAAAIDGQIIKPGEVFSFNKVVGPRSTEAGYKEAKVIVNNEFVDSLGGGICQVSSTLYNALLKADVEIVQRSPHSLVVKYVPLGQDAAVAFGSKDFQFKNNMPSALVIKTSVKGNTLTIKLFGDVSLKKSISVTNNIVKVYPFKIVYKYDPTIPKGRQEVSQKGENGYRVVSKMTVYQNGKVIGQKSLSPSYYKPLDQIILIGTKQVSSRPSSGNKLYRYQPPVSSPAKPNPTGGTASGGTQGNRPQAGTGSTGNGQYQAEPDAVVNQ